MLFGTLDIYLIFQFINHRRPPNSNGKYLGPIKPSEIIIIGDSQTSDIRGGNNAGIDCCWYNPKNYSNDTDLKIDYEIHNLNEVMTIIEGGKNEV